MLLWPWPKFMPNSLAMPFSSCSSKVPSVRTSSTPMPRKSASCSSRPHSLRNAVRSSSGAGELASARAALTAPPWGRLRAEERGDGGVLRAQRLGLADRRAVRQEPLHDVRLAPFRRAVDAALARRVLLVEQRVPPRGLQHGPDGLQRLEPPEATRLVDDGPPHVVHGRLHKDRGTHFIQRLTDDLGAVAHLQLRPDRGRGAAADGSLRRRTDEVAGVLGPRVLPRHRRHLRIPPLHRRHLRHHGAAHRRHLGPLRGARDSGAAASSAALAPVRPRR